jgi:cytochrome oxidase Cu insertion factor (SCO1/SenC/PrrC family)
MIPHERSLVNRLSGKPFVLIGVNSDTNPEKLKNDLKENQVTWRSFQNQRKDNKISDEWKVQGWPTLYLIDHKGVIKKKWLGGPTAKLLDQEVEKLVQAAEKDKSP